MKFLTSIDLSQNEIQNAIMQPLAAPPANPKIGQIYFNSIDLTLYLWTGEKWIPVPTKTSQLENDSGFITSGDIPEGAAASTTTPKMNGTAAVGTEPAEASCIIAHLFVELALPCSCCKREDGVIVIQGKTYDGSNARVTIKGEEVRYYGKQRTLAAIRAGQCRPPALRP